MDGLTPMVERARVVDWLRREADAEDRNYGLSFLIADALRKRADLIERGTPTPAEIARLSKGNV